jgi:hypothetical protein
MRTVSSDMMTKTERQPSHELIDALAVLIKPLSRIAEKPQRMGYRRAISIKVLSNAHQQTGP